MELAKQQNEELHTFHITKNDAEFIALATSFAIGAITKERELVAVCLTWAERIASKDDYGPDKAVALSKLFMDASFFTHNAD